MPAEPDKINSPVEIRAESQEMKNINTSQEANPLDQIMADLAKRLGELSKELD